MADLAISPAAILTGAGLASGDLVPILDVSAAAGSKGSRMTIAELGIGLRTVGGFGTLAEQAASAVAITGGSITGLTDFGVALANNTAATGISLGTITDTTSRPFTISQTWNNAGGTFTALKLNVTNTASNAASNFLDIRTANNSMVCTLSVAGTLSLYGGNNITLTGSNGQITSVEYLTNAQGAYLQNALFGMRSDYALTWYSSTVGYGTVSAVLGRKAAASLQMGANHATTPTAQMFSAHNVTTGTGASLTLSGGTGSVAGGACHLAASVTTGAPVPRVTADAIGLGFYNVTPVARQVVPTGSSTDTLITALQTLGLISQS